MIIAELYTGGRPLVILEKKDDTGLGSWARLQEALARGIVGGSSKRMEVRADVFLAELEVLREIQKVYREKVDLGQNLKEQLIALASDKKARETAVLAPEDIDTSHLEDQLKTAGFIRTLKPFQLENLAKIRSLPHGADFSVPGAGKTTVALANYALARSEDGIKRMLVIGPLAAFSAWKEDSKECLSPSPIVTVHGGAESFITPSTEILLTNYNRVASDYDRIRAYVAEKPTQVILDEAHRVKRGALGVHGRAVLDLAYAAKRRDVLTGTPAPQGAFDLIALIRFLYPGQDRQIMPASAYVERDGRNNDVLHDTSKAIGQYFVRTQKSKLGLPPTTFEVIRRPMGEIQQAIYDSLTGKYRASFLLSKMTRREFERLGRIVMYLLEAASNPMLLAAGSDEVDEIGFLHPPLEMRGDEPLIDLLNSYKLYETPWKYRELEQIVAQSAANGEKVLIWSTFVRNLKALSRHLSAYQPAMIHGGVPSEDSSSSGSSLTREAELKRFKEDKNCSVLLANPAAMGEGVSLHHWCHHAIYLDRTFNAGHFLQSQDRIHRLGLKENTLTKFTLLISENTIDDSVDGRLREKVTALSKLLDDVGLVNVALPESDEHHSDPPVYPDDMQAVLAHIGVK